MARSRFTQSDVTRATKGALKAGLTVVRVEIDQDGRVVIYAVAEAETSPDAELDKWMRGRGAA